MTLLRAELVSFTLKNCEKRHSIIRLHSQIRTFWLALENKYKMKLSEISGKHSVSIIEKFLKARQMTFNYSF